jgi:hypothetical protein
MASRAVVVHLKKQETALEAKIVAAIERAEAMIVENRAVVAAAQFARLEAASNITPFVSAAEGVRARMVAQGLIS